MFSPCTHDVVLGSLKSKENSVPEREKQLSVGESAGNSAGASSTKAELVGVEKCHFFPEKYSGVFDVSATVDPTRLVRRKSVLQWRRQSRWR